MRAVAHPLRKMVPSITHAPRKGLNVQKYILSDLEGAGVYVCPPSRNPISPIRILLKAFYTTRHNHSP
jgi:hypothetical protein